jgi:hypothetical protein
MNSLDLDNLAKEDNVLLNKVAAKIRQPYIDLIATISKGLEDNIHWQVGSIACRDPFMGRLYIRLCYITLLEEIWLSGRIVEQIIVSDRHLAVVLNQMALKHKKKCSIVYKNRNSWLSRIKQLQLYQLAVSIWHLFFRYCASRGKTDRYNFSKPLTLLDICVLGVSGPTPGMVWDGHYHDRHYPGLLDELDDAQKEDIVYIPAIIKPMNFWRAFRRLRETKQGLIVIDDFLKIQDYIATLMHPFKLMQITVPPTMFNGIDVRSLIISDINYYSCGYSSMTGLLNHYFVERLHAHGVAVRLLVEWYENQAVDRGMVAGFKKHYPQVEIVGYQGYVVSTQFYIHHHPTNSDHAANVVPDKVAVIGRNLVPQVKEFCQDFEAVVAPAFRFKMLWKERKFHPDPVYFTVLLGLPASTQDSAEIIETILAVVGQLPDKTIRYMIKPHPLFSAADIKSKFSMQWPDAISFIDGTMSECLEQADLFVSNSSSSCIESLVLGVPVIIMANNHNISANPIPPDIKKELWCECFCADEFIAALLRYRQYDEAAVLRNRQLGKNIRANYFEPITKTGVKNFLRL